MRCTACGGEARSELRVCPECGATLRRHRFLGGVVRCRTCQARVPANLRICPYCGAELRRSWRVLLRTLAVVAALMGLGYVGYRYVPWRELIKLPGRLRVPSVAFLATPTATATLLPTRTATRTATPRPTSTGTPLPPTKTPTPAPPTATRKPAPTGTPTPRFQAPRLIAPANEVEFSGGDTRIVLSWEPTGTLAADEWYALSVRFTANGAVSYGGTWTKDTAWTVPNELYIKAGERERTFRWDVTVMKQTATKSDGGRDGVALGPTSETRTFLWY